MCVELDDITCLNNAIRLGVVFGWIGGDTHSVIGDAETATEGTIRLESDGNVGLKAEGRLLF
eukprot:7049161-Pyramimonas_sp.AAC.1